MITLIKPPSETRLNRNSPQERGLIVWYPLVNGHQGAIIRNMAKRTGHKAATFSTPVWAANERFGIVPAFAGSSFIDTGLTSIGGVNLFCDGSQPFSATLWGRTGAGVTGTYFGRASATGTNRTFHFATNPNPDAPFVWVRGTLNTSFGLNHLDGLWHFYAFSYNGSTLAFYSDGNLVGNLTIGTAVEETTQRILIGARTNGANFALTGNITDFRLFNIPLTANNVWRQYNFSSRFHLHEPAPKLFSVNVPPAIVTGDAALSGAGDLTASGYVITASAAALDANGDLAATGLVVTSGLSALSGEGALIAQANIETVADAVLSGAGDVSAAGLVITSGVAALSGDSQLSVTGLVIVSGLVALSGSGEALAGAILITYGTTVLQGNGALAASGETQGIAVGEASLSGLGSLSATGLVIVVSVATLAGLGSLVAVGIVPLTSPVGGGSVSGPGRASTVKSQGGANSVISPSDNNSVRS